MYSLVAHNLEHMEFLILTLWMTQKQGIHLIGYEMKEKLIKPSVAVAQHVERWRRFGRKGLTWRTHLRFALMLAFPLSFLLLSASLNTIGVLKGRWYQDSLPNFENE